MERVAAGQGNALRRDAAGFEERCAASHGRSMVCGPNQRVEASAVFPEHFAGNPRASKRAAWRTLRSVRRYAGVDPVGDHRGHGRGAIIRRASRASRSSGWLGLREKDKRHDNPRDRTRLRTVGSSRWRDTATRKDSVASRSRGRELVRRSVEWDSSSVRRDCAHGRLGSEAVASRAVRSGRGETGSGWVSHLGECDFAGRCCG